VPINTRPTWDEARSLSYRPGEPLPTEVVGLGDASGRRLALDVVALCDLPHYESSAMDGWAVAGAAPWTAVEHPPLHEHECLPIVTGGRVPPGTTAVLRSEHAVTFLEAARTVLHTTSDARPDEPRPGEHIRHTGTEAVLGELLIPAGRMLNPAHVALAASAGHDELSVAARPRVTLLLTGDEIVASGIPTAGRVRDSFGPVLPPVLAGMGAHVVGALHLGDSLATMVESLRDQPGASDVVITTGGTGHSAADQLRRALGELGASILVDGIRMRPGGPSLLARLPDGRHLIGLPGNPLAAILGLLTLAGPLFASLTGGPEPSTGWVVSGAALAGRAGTHILIPYRLNDGKALPTNWSTSAMMRGLAESDGIIVCPPQGVSPGQGVTAIALPWATDH
jgi:molybdopterin molybdotransferase